MFRCGHWSQVATAAATAQHHQQPSANSQSQGHIGVPTTHTHVGSPPLIPFTLLATVTWYDGIAMVIFRHRDTHIGLNPGWPLCHGVTVSRVYTDSLFTLSVASLHVHPATAKTQLLGPSTAITDTAGSRPAGTQPTSKSNISAVPNSHITMACPMSLT